MREPRPDWSPLGVNFKILDEHPHLFIFEFLSRGAEKSLNLHPNFFLACLDRFSAPTNCPWVSEDEFGDELMNYRTNIATKHFCHPEILHFLMTDTSLQKSVTHQKLKIVQTAC